MRQRLRTRVGGESYIFNLPLLRLDTGVEVQLPSGEALNSRNVHVYCFLHHLNRLVARVLRQFERKNIDKVGGDDERVDPASSPRKPSASPRPSPVFLGS